MEIVKRLGKAYITFRKKLQYRAKDVSIKSGCYIAGKDTSFEGKNVINKNTYFKGTIGLGSYIGPECSIDASIGRFCSIAANVKTVNGFHPSNRFVSTHPAFFSTVKQAKFTFVEEKLFQELKYADEQCHAVTIGNDVWIGENAVIFGGVHIGDGAIIAACAVVTKDVQPYAIVGGVPAKLIRMRFNEETVDKLLAFKWWDKPLQWIEENSSYFRDIEDFIGKIGGQNGE